MNQQGSILIIMVSILTFMGIVAITAMHRITCLHDIALQRTERLKIECATEALLNYGIAHCMQSIKTDTITCEPWPPPYGMYFGIVNIIQQEKGAHIEALLKKDDAVICQLSCTMQHETNRQKEDKKCAVISEWCYTHKQIKREKAVQ